MNESIKAEPSAMDRSEPDAMQRAIIAERYKYINGEMARLNANTHRNLRLFAALAPALVSPLFYVVFVVRDKISWATAQLLISGLYGLICALGLMVIISISADVFSWLDYRKEEVELLKRAGLTYRTAPNWKNAWRWHETYAIIGIVLLLVGFWWLMFRWLLPALSANS